MACILKIFWECSEIYYHVSVYHSTEFVNQVDPYVHTQNIEYLWLCLKKFLRFENLNNRKRSENYLAEFTFPRRFNN